MVDCHERYVSAGLARVLDHLPVGAFRRLVAAILAASGVPEEDLQDTNIGTERSFPGSPHRYDVAAPLAFPRHGAATLITQLIFENKLGAPNIAQLRRYKETLGTSVCLVSVATSPTGPNAGWVDLTWPQLAVALRALLRHDAHERFADIDLGSRPELTIDPPDAYIGRECEQRIEDFLALLSERRLIRSARRVLVATGSAAAASCEQHGVYVYGANWDAHFSQVVIVHGRRIRFVGEVRGRYDTEDDNARPPEHVLDALRVHHATPAGPLVTVTPMSTFHGRDGTPQSVDALKSRPWPSGAFVQSHRYFDDIATFAAAWTAHR